MSRYVVPLFVLTVLYLLVLGSANPWDLLIGLVLSLGLLLLFRRFREHERLDDRRVSMPAKRVLAFFPFAGAVTVDVLQGTWNVLLVSLGVRPYERAGIVEVPIDERTRRGVFVTTLVTTLSPGSILVDIDWEREIILYHILDATDPDDVRAQQRRLYERYQRHVFP